MINDVSTDTTIENFAALALPFPSSFATRTLQKESYKPSFQGKLQQMKNKIKWKVEVDYNCNINVRKENNAITLLQP